MSDYSVQQGATFSLVLSWQQNSLVIVPVQAITKSTRARITTTTPHAVPNTGDWPVFVRGVGGMTRLNHKAADVEDDPASDAAYRAKVIDATTIEVSADTIDSASYTSGGEIVFRPAVDLTGYTARMHIRRSVSAADTLLELSSAAPTAGGSTITLGGALGTVEVKISAEDTAAITWTSAVYDIELEAASGEVTRVLSGKLVVSREVTR